MDEMERNDRGGVVAGSRSARPGRKCLFRVIVEECSIISQLTPEGSRSG